MARIKAKTSRLYHPTTKAIKLERAETRVAKRKLTSSLTRPDLVTKAAQRMEGLAPPLRQVVVQTVAARSRTPFIGLTALTRGVAIQRPMRTARV